MWVAFANAKATHILSAKIQAYMPYLIIKVLTIRTKDIITLEQLGLDVIAFDNWNTQLSTKKYICTSLKYTPVSSLQILLEICVADVHPGHTW